MSRMTQGQEASRVTADVVSIDPFVQRLRDARLRTGMSQERFAAAIQTSRRNMLRWEGGHHRPSHVHLVRIASIAKVTLDWLVNGEPTPAERAA